MAAAAAKSTTLSRNSATRQYKFLSNCQPNGKRGKTFVSMADEWVRARIAGAAAFVSMADKGVGARIAGAVTFVSMADKGASARIAGAAVAVRDLLVLRRVFITVTLKSTSTRYCCSKSDIWSADG